MANKNKAPLTAAEKRTYRLVLFRRTFSYLGIGLVVSALVGGLYGDRMHFIWALCAVGAILLAFGWWEYLKVTETLRFLSRKKEKKAKVPFALRKEKEHRSHKPAFLQKAEDFEDDLTPYTTADEEIFSEKRRQYALVISRMTAGAILLILSFFIPQ
ncbi:MAG: hypothetical protein IJZ08_09080 [Clostridia bacterium]|nr:hypothetical protein [Clostridia bacterium]